MEADTQSAFTEFQLSRKNKLFWIILLIPLAAFGLILITRFAPITDKNNQVINPIGLWIIFGFGLILLVYAWRMGLETRIDAEGIRYRYAPVLRKTTFIPWAEISTCSVEKYHPVKEFGGWGIRTLSSGKKAFTVAGNMAVRILLKNGKSVVLGTSDPEKISMAISRFYIPSN